MTVANRLRLSGNVCGRVVRKTSPSGIPHCQFVLEHQSMQEEAGLSRHAWCRIPVIISGTAHLQITQHITVGTQLIIDGFLHCHQAATGQSKMVLHAEQIELIDSGD
ncbi:primosomal replication protein N [Tatumella terrea]|uniref:Replication restart protein PriB n=1 Tax=Tatumella terrea TaxID=419007 RepID=A0ABW1W1N8_9GAMM|nr:primosomal replication protein N [Tatumella sp. JGM118]MBS0908971.1 primosomal replication protein N [Tatumella sp. JGM118]